MNDLERAVRALGQRLLAVRAAEWAVRWAFATSLGCFVGLIAALFGAFPMPAGVAAAAVTAAAAAGAAMAVARAPRTLDVARRLDRSLDLDERLSTALEARPGPLADLQRADALRALWAADRRRAARFALSLEGRLLPLMLALCAGAALAQGRRPAAEPPVAGAHVEAMQWIASPRAPTSDATAPLDVRLAKLSDAVADGAAPIEELVTLARDAQDKILADPTLTADQIRRLKEIGRAARGAAAALARDSDHGPLAWAEGDDPLLREAFGERGQRRGPSARPDAAEVEVVPSGRPIDAPRADGAAAPRLWDVTYDEIVRRYFGVNDGR